MFAIFSSASLGRFGLGDTTPEAFFEIASSSGIVASISNTFYVDGTKNAVGIGTSVIGTNGRLVISGGGYSNGEAFNGTQSLVITTSDTIGAGIDLESTDTGGEKWLLISTGNDYSGTGAGSFVIENIVPRFIISPSGFMGIGTTTPTTVLEVQGTASASYLLTGNTLQVGGYSSEAYSRFGTDTTTHAGTIIDTDDLLISGGFEVNASAAFNGFVGLYNTATASLVFQSGSDVEKKFTIQSNATGAGTTDRLSILNGNNIEVFSIASTGLTDIDTLRTGPMSFEDNAGIVSWTNMEITSASANTIMSYSAQIDSIPILTVYGITGATNNLLSPRVGINTTTPTTVLEVQGTASASYLLTGNTLQVGGYSSQAYSRFGTDTTGYLNWVSAPNDLLISGDLEVNATAQFDSFVRINKSSARAFVVTDGTGGTFDDIFVIDTTASASNSGITITGGTSQTGNLLELQDSSGTMLTRFSASGGLFMNIASDSAIDIRNGSNISVFTVNTNSQSASISSNFEVGGYASASSITGSAFTGVGDCNDSGEALGWDAGSFSCVSAGSGESITKVKTADQLFTANSTVLIYDDTLFFSVGSNEQWVFQFWILGSTNTYADYKFGINQPTTTTACWWDVIDLENAGTSTPTACGNGNSRDLIGVTSNDTFIINGAIITGTLTSPIPSVSFMFAQSAGTSTDGPTIQDTSSVVAFKVTGADLAEIYYTDETLETGDLVSVDESVDAGVKKSSGSYDKNAVGVVSKKPGLVIGELQENNVGHRWTPVALAGRIPVKVSAENGIIKPGDYLTTSSVPGVAMKATRAGPIIGQALMYYNNIEPGTTIAFIKNGYFNGESLETIITNNESTEGESPSGADPPEDFGEALLAELLRQKETVTFGSVNDIWTDRLAAGLEIITPKITVKELFADSISPSLGNDLNLRLDELGRITIGSKVASSSDEPVITFDVSGNAFFAGEVTADRVNANQISGLEILTDQISALSSYSFGSGQQLLAISQQLSLISEQLSVSGSASFDNLTAFRIVADNIESPILTAFNGRLEVLSSKNAEFESLMASFSAQLASASAQIAVLASNSFDSGKDLALSAGLSVEGSAIFNGGLTVDSIGSEGESVIFNSDVNFFGRPYFNSDTGGFVVITAGSAYASVSFESEYLNQPVVNATISLNASSSAEIMASSSFNRQFTLEEMESLIFNNDIRFIVTNKSTKGFTVKLNKPVPFDVQFSWISLAIKDAKTVFSPRPSPSAIKDGAMSSPTPTPLPTVESSPDPSATPIPNLEFSPTPTPDLTLTPTPEPSPELTPEPSPEVTPTPEPTPESTPESTL